MELTCSVDRITRLSPEQVKDELAGEERTHINALLRQLEELGGGAQP